MTATQLVAIGIRIVSVFAAWRGIHHLRDSLFLYGVRNQLGQMYWLAPDEKAANWTEVGSEEWQHLLTYGIEALIIAALLWFFSRALAVWFTKGLPE